MSGIPLELLATAGPVPLRASEDEREPLVSVIVPALDEEGTIDACLDAVLAQEWPAERLEVIVVDGGSRDATAERVAARARVEPRLRLLANPGALVSRALNLGIAAAQGEVVVRIDAHALPAPDYVRRAVAALVETGAATVGGTMSPRGEGAVGRAMACAMRHPFGVGPARFRFATAREAVDTVYLGAFRRDLPGRVGPFDERLVRNQDYEMNWRIRAAGGTVLVDPAIRSTYLPRTSLGAIWSQYHEYGYWKRQMLRLHPRSLLPRQLAAPLLLAGLAASLPAALLALAGAGPALLALPLAVLLGGYLLACLAVSATLAARHGAALFGLLPLVFASMHLAWGSGFLRACLTRPPWRRSRP
ncbi:MAG: glycosyltransferase family 2 protein [Thermoanaerobaculia bacterium]|nr:glycosyltransferase family 2 protein [Thermoanaerobaculia bacterium]